MVRVQVERYNGKTEIVEAEVFDAVELEQKMMEPNVIAIAIGNQLFARIDILHAKEITEEIEIIEEN